MGWAALAGAVITSGASMYNSNKAAKASGYRPVRMDMQGLGIIGTDKGQLQVWEDADQQQRRLLQQGYEGQAMNAYADGPSSARYRHRLGNYGMDANSANALPSTFFGNGGMFQNQAYGSQMLGNQSLQQAMGGYGGGNFLGMGQQMLGNYGQQNLGRNMITNFDPSQAGNDFTNLLRQQAQPQEQQAASSMMNNLFSRGRLGTTGGANQMSGLASAQQQADVARQVQGQQFGLQHQLMQQQGYDQALNNEQGRQMSHLGMAGNLAGMGAGLYGQSYDNANLAMGMGQQADAFGFNRMMGLNEANYGRTQDRFARNMQLFGADASLRQQDLQDMGFFANMRQADQQQLLDMARISASAGQAQTAAAGNAAAIKNQGTQNAIAGMMGAWDTYMSSKNKGP
jgi:hypothetical protein